MPPLRDDKEDRERGKEGAENKFFPPPPPLTAAGGDAPPPPPPHGYQMVIDKFLDSIRLALQA